MPVGPDPNPNERDIFESNLVLIHEELCDELEHLLDPLPRAMASNPVTSFFFKLIYTLGFRNMLRNRLSSENDRVIDLLRESKGDVTDLVNDDVDRLIDTNATLRSAKPKHENYPALKDAVRDLYAAILNTYGKVAGNVKRVHEDYDDLVRDTLPTRDAAETVLSLVHKPTERILKLLDADLTILKLPGFLRGTAVAFVRVGYEHAKDEMERVLGRIYDSGKSESGN